ncbi:hypothetical protein [Ramlibacter sp. PS4R-6]|uniref:hypothetical protein n=1 Tax=Ramlibacter sp. PS4R-6 TaxID=3133438 RepID=UPI0030A58731
MHDTRDDREVTRAVCASLSRVEGSVMQELLKLRNELVAPGARVRVKYAVLYTSGWLVLWVEGSEDAVRKAIARAAADPRNEHQKLLHFSRGPAGLADRVLVATTQTTLRPTQFARWVVHLIDEGAGMEPSEIWNRLGAPCLIDRSPQPQRPVQQYAFIAADDHGPVDQLRRLGEHFKSPVVYQRFGVAQHRSPDMGMAYVDVWVRRGPARIRLLSGAAMARSAVRHSMPPLDAIILLLGGRPLAVVELVTNVAKALLPLERPPKVWVAGAPGEPTSASLRLLEQLGVAAEEAPLPGTGRNDLVGLLAAAGLKPVANR